MMIGFLLGILAGLCLLDSHVSRRLKLGIFIGLVANAALGRESPYPFKLKT
jgi:hypothetical protein